MKIVCPCCQTSFPVEAGLLDADGKKLGMALAGAEPSLGRAIIQYLSLHKPAKTALRMAKSAKVAEEVVALATAPEIRRNGLGRPNAVRYWVGAIEQMVDNRAKLRLPLSGHGYLIEVAFGLSDKQDAARERQAEADARAGKHLGGGSGNAVQTPKETPLERQLNWIARMVELGQFTDAKAEEERAKARAKFGDSDG